jgi:signal transduction histidine kinase/CheY-like chemotaxis protein
MKGFFSRTLTGKTLLRIAVVGAAVLVVFGALGAFMLYRQIERQDLERLSLQAAERARIAEQVLEHVCEMHRTVRDEFVRRWPLAQDAATAGRFDTLLLRDAAGAWRSRPEIADGRLYPTGWVRAGTALSDDLRQRVVLFHDLSRQFGPGAATRNDNPFFVSIPEQSNMGYDPFLYPDFSKDVTAGYDQLDAEWGRTAYRKAAPNEPTRWSTPEIDEVNPGLGPVFAVLTPIHVGQRHLATVGTTILVKEFLARVLPPAEAGTRYLAIHPDGRLLTDARLPPRFLPARTADMPAEPPAAAPAFAALTASGGESYTGHSAADDLLYALARIDGPGWYIAAMLPGSEVRARAAAPVLWTVAVGAVALLLPLGIVAAMLRRQVTEPLSDLTRAAEAMAGGATGVSLPASRNDEIGRLASAFRDAQDELARQRDALHQSEKLAALGGLLAGVAHELNNPLSVVVGRAVQLEESASSAADRARARQIHLAAERCARIVKTFLAMARRQASVRAPTAVNDVVRGALELLGYSLQSGDVHVEAKLDENLPPVHADADQLSQVFLNLFTNAQQAMAGIAGPRRLGVRTCAACGGAQVRVEVRDTGPGVPPGLASRVFDPYFTTKPVGEGTGVGLAVSLGIVQAHGGSLVLQPPAPQGGACFVVTLPAWHDEAAARPADAGGSGAAVAVELGVLVVDDEPEIGGLLRDILEHAGHGVALADSGVEALRLLDEERFDVVITDLKMPQMDGRALYAEIARRHPAMAARVIVMTGDALGGSAREFVQAHALPLLDKPFQPGEVLAAVQSAMARQP